MSLIIHALLIFMATVLAVISLVSLGKKKKHFQIFPDSMKKEMFHDARIMTVLNIFSVVFVFISFFLIRSAFFYIPIVTSIFLSVHSLITQDEAFSDLKDTRSTGRKQSRKGGKA